MVLVLCVVFGEMYRRMEINKSKQENINNNAVVVFAVLKVKG